MSFKKIFHREKDLVLKEQEKEALYRVVQKTVKQPFEVKQPAVAEKSSDEKS
jgi:hypothetical protein